MIRLVPLIADAAHLIIGWAERKELAEYFRHFPPKIEWASPEGIMRVFTNHYLVAYEDRLIGLVGFSQVSTPARSIEVGFMLDHRDLPNPQEISWEVGLQMLDYVFKDLRYNRATCRLLTHRKNLRERIEQYGWQYEGTMKQSSYFNGEYLDEDLFAITRDQYKVRSLAPTKEETCHF